MGEPDGEGLPRLGRPDARGRDHPPRPSRPTARWRARADHHYRLREEGELMTARDLAIDPARTATLIDGWRAAVCLGPDGTEECWLVSPAPQLPHGCACR